MSGVIDLLSARLTCIVQLVADIFSCICSLCHISVRVFAVVVSVSFLSGQLILLQLLLYGRLIPRKAQ